jgi:prevent-host-death family protein
LLTADQHFGHRRFSSQIITFQALLRSTDLAAVGSGSPVLGAGRDNFRDSSCSGCLCRSHRGIIKFDADLMRPTMLDLANDIRSLSDFKRNTLELLERLRETGHPLVLTVNGKAELVVQDAAAYQALLDRVEAIEGIQRGLTDVKAGRTKLARQVFSRLRRKHGIPR